MFFRSNPAGGAEWLIVGLGNPGPKYDGTRHNAGFMALDWLSDKWGGKVTRAKFQGLYDTVTVDGRKVTLLKPQTFMNLSGHSVGALADFFKIPPQRVIVLCDDVTQAPGKLRIRPSGSAGGHNGLKDIIACLGSQEFPRVRIGVGEKPHPDYDLADWVLGRFSAEDRKALEGRFADVEDAVRLIMDGRLNEAQNRHNR
ncbi:aminoacyl-tRNA hydrolase [Gemmiger sp. An120]|uniref:aminoacyl-tRNA hydrolase n=1 Tax=Gemmiger TaxID=204475 RepID=UPI000B3A8510|nr:MULTISPECIES: aminoacyl-tRNA hydrolase [Gemmiger]MBM6915698.1 aminoacyl-tRNA hydrolase [Gemmiger formicilis]OUQ42305.1 aminoacyl-tRNA hydrolase [Gemmiger sp. An120]HIX33531.1 aminoacyl-tRNA hydrolase [Candidatus Gemmiger avium]